MNRQLRITTILACSFLMLREAPAAATEPTANCEVKITTPLPGDKVGKDGRVRGTAKIPDGTYLWVFDHMKDLVAEWWPQGGRPVVIGPDGDWVIIAAYGRLDDVGQKFEVAAVVVDSNTNNDILDWFKTAKQLDFPARVFPTAVEGCIPVKVVVDKISH